MTVLNFPSGTPEQHLTDPAAAAERILNAMASMDRGCAAQLLTAYLGMFRALGRQEGLDMALNVVREWR